MRPTLRASLLVLGGALAGCSEVGPAAPLANAGRTGLVCTSVVELVALEEDQLDLGRAALIVQQELCPDTDVEAAVARLDELARGFAPPEDLNAHSQAVLFVDYLHNRHGFVSVDDARTEGSALLAKVLERGEGNCVGLSTLYLAVAERAGVELAAVSLPWHVYVELSRGGERVGLEPTIGGLYSAEAPVDAWFFSEVERDAGTYLRPLTRRETLGMLLVETALRTHSAGDPRSAASLARHAVACAPELPATHEALGVSLLLGGETETALAAFTRAVELNPESGDYLAARAEALLRLERPGEALVDLEAALRADAEHPQYWALAAKAHLDLEQRDPALAALDAALNVRWTQLHPMRRFAIEGSIPDRRSFEAELWRTLAGLHLELAEELVAAMEGGGAPGMQEFRREMACADLAGRIGAALMDKQVVEGELSGAVDGSPSLSADARIRRYRRALLRAQPD